MRQQGLSNGITLVLLVAMLASAPWLGEFWIGFWARCVTWMFLAVSFGIAYSYARIPSVSQATVFGVGAYVTTWLAPVAKGEIVLLIVAGSVASAFVSLALGLLIYRMTINGAAIATIIVAVIGFVLCNAAVPLTGGSNGLLLADLHYAFAGHAVEIGSSMFMLILATTVLILLLLGIWFFAGTHTWTVIRAIQQNEVRARSLGYSVDAYRLSVFCFAGACAGLGGSFYALVSRQVTTDMLSLGMSLKAILWAVVGGVSSASGGPLGVLVIQLASELLARWTLRVDSIIGLLLIVTALTLPQGLVGLFEAINVRLPAPKEHRRDRSIRVKGLGPKANTSK